jgi:hypothetical protein
MIVQNISGRDIKVPELRKIIKAGSGYISLPYDVARKYKKLLKPIQMSDTLMNSKLSNNDVEGKVKAEATAPAHVVPEVATIVEKEAAPAIDPEILEEIEEIEDLLDGFEELDEEEIAFAKKEADKVKRATAARERRAKAKAEKGDTFTKGKKKTSKKKSKKK